MSDGRTHLAVLGSPISHSKSPAIHRAAFGVLALNWTYEAIEVSGSQIADFVASRDETWRGLSLTMPLKRDVLPALHWRDELVEVVGGANTVLLSANGARGYNTDVQGVIASFAEVGVSSLSYVHLLGAGATAASVLVAVARLGATRVLISARTPAKAADLIALGRTLGVEVVVRAWGVMDRSMMVPDAVISTLPGGECDLVFAEPIRAQSVLFDVAYDPWPSDLAASWDAAGGTVISGLDLLINQAVGQLRLFVGGDQNVALPREPEVVAAMRLAVA
ncbi:MAG: shikimate dehydrogenase [Rhodoglobus sp.]|nr:shikimate dehydrogenase [Rhodoglobus sp.]